MGQFSIPKLNHQKSTRFSVGQPAKNHHLIKDTMSNFSEFEVNLESNAFMPAPTTNRQSLPVVSNPSFDKKPLYHKSKIGQGIFMKKKILSPKSSQPLLSTAKKVQKDIDFIEDSGKKLGHY